MTGLGLCYVYCILTVFSTHKHNQNIFYSNNQGGGREEGSNPFFLGSESFVDPINPKGRFIFYFFIFFLIFFLLGDFPRFIVRCGNYFFFF